MMTTKKHQMIMARPWLLTLIALMVLWGGYLVRGQPAQVLLLRHAEKPADDADPQLSAKGRERAQALAEWLGRPNELTRQAPVAALYASRMSKQGRGRRTAETLAPLGQWLNLTVLTPYRPDEGEALARAVMTNPAYRGKTVVVCWSHSELSQIAAAFGVQPEPPAWKDKRFDRVWRLTFAEERVHWSDLPQRLLKGDSK